MKSNPWAYTRKMRIIRLRRRVRDWFTPERSLGLVLFLFVLTLMFLYVKQP